MNKYLIKKLKEGRASVGLKQSEVAEKIGIKGNTLSNYENGVSEPDIDTFCILCDIYNLDPSEILGEAFGLGVQGNDFSIKPSEIDHIKRYRNLDESGKKHTDYVLEREMERVKALKKEVEEKERQATRIAELEAAQAPTARRIIPFIDLQPHISNMSHMVEYFRSASAGDGVFIMGSEGTEQVRIPDVPGVREMDYVIKISGTSMEPDYHDEDVVLVSRTAEMHYGDVGIFVINGKAYIKEYGKYELISRNPESSNIKISEYDNIVCMGKVVGRIREEDMIKV